MAIFNKKRDTSSSPENQDFYHPVLTEANNSFDKGEYENAFINYQEALIVMNSYNYCGYEQYLAIKRLIVLSFQLGKNEEAYKCVALLLMTEEAKKNICYCLFDIAKIAYEANVPDFARGLIKAVYQTSDGSYFAESDLKKYLEYAGIHDERTFENYSEDY